MNNPTSPSPERTGRYARIGCVVGAAAILAGCASVKTPNPQDPWESYNRGMFAFNETFDGVLLKPVATAYDQLMPDPAQNCVHNVFNNIADVWSGLNSFLQGRGHDFFNTLGRVLFNSTMGLGGCIDVASMNGAQRIQNDFGVTLGVWGLDSGPYVVLPFIGASSLRDTTAFVGTLAADVSPLTPVLHLENISLRNGIIGLYAIDTRASLLPADRLVDEVALDRYSFIRDAYIQRRESMVQSRRNGDTLPNYDAGLPDYSDDEPADPNATPTPVAPAKQ